jgi:hypothetical protein
MQLATYGSDLGRHRRRCGTVSPIGHEQLGKELMFRDCYARHLLTFRGTLQTGHFRRFSNSLRPFGPEPARPTKKQISRRIDWMSFPARGN